MENYIHTFDNSLAKSKRLRKPLNNLYKINGTFREETDIRIQKKEIDGYWTLPNGKEISVEEKCHELNWDFKYEMLFELLHINNDGTPRGNGWAIKCMKSDIIIDFCFETGDYYVYKTKTLMQYIRKCYYNNDFPPGCTYKFCSNPNFSTTNIKVPRKYLIEYAMMQGHINKDGTVV